MFASRPQEAPSLPSFNELMHSIVGQPPSNMAHVGKQIPMPMLPAVAPAQWTHQTGFQYHVMQTPQHRLGHPTSNYHTQNSTFVSTTPVRHEYYSPSSSVASSPSSSDSPIELSRSPASSAGEVEAVSPQLGQGNSIMSVGSKRNHVCKTCARPFTTSGHLARHNRIHTGERNHVCPFPHCNARFARQDNCTQHYRTHLNGKNKRSRGKKIKA